MALVWKPRNLLSLAACLTLTLQAGPGRAAQSGEAMTPDRYVMRSLEMCWEVVDGANAEVSARSRGFYRMPGTSAPYFFRDVGGRVVTVSVSLEPNAAGQAEPACRVTVLKPNLDTPWTPRGSLLDNASGLVDRLVSVMSGAPTNYQVVTRRQAHPRRAGHLRTLLQRRRGDTLALFYFEEGPQAIEILWAEGAVSALSDPSIPDFGTDPAGRRGAQAFVNDRWEMAFCELNPHTCETPAQRAANAASAAAARPSSDWVLPFSGIGQSAARARQDHLNDPRTHAQRLRDQGWWDNYRRSGRGGYD